MKEKNKLLIGVKKWEKKYRKKKSKLLMVKREPKNNAINLVVENIG